MKWPFIGTGFMVLLIAAYYDSSRGPLMPLLNQEFTLSYAQSSWFLVAGYAAALPFMLFLIFLSRTVSDRALALGVCVISLAASLLAPTVRGFWSLMVLAVLMGFVISAFGALCNQFVVWGTTSENRARYLSALHMMFGVGSFLAPTVVGLVSDRGWAWSTVPLVVLPFSLFIALFIIFKIPESQKREQLMTQSGGMSYLQLFFLLTFGIYAAAEVCTSMWLVPYLVETQGMSVGKSAPYAAGFFVALAVSRGLCFLPLKLWQERLVLWGCLALAAVFILLGRMGWLLGFSLAGVMGPFFPLFLAHISRRFPLQFRKINLWILTVIQIALGSFHLVLGNLTDLWGMEITYWIPLMALLIVIGIILFYLRWESKNVANLGIKAEATC